MGGLIANNRSAGQTGIPVLGEDSGARQTVPQRHPAGGSDRTSDHGYSLTLSRATTEGSALTEELKQQLDLHARIPALIS